MENVETAVVEGIRDCSFQRCQSCGSQVMKQKLANALLQVRTVVPPLSFCFCFWLSLEISFAKAVAGYNTPMHDIGIVRKRKN